MNSEENVDVSPIDLTLSMCDHVGGESLSEKLLVAREFCKKFPSLSEGVLDVDRQISLLQSGQKGKIFFLEELTREMSEKLSKG